MANALVSPVDLAAFPNAPFSDMWVDIAAASVRADAGWHIAPVLTETITVRYTGCDVVLPTTNAVSVASVNGMATGWELLPSGILHLCRPPQMLVINGGHGSPILHIELTHGYDQCPVDLLPVLAARAQAASQPVPAAAIASETTGPYSVTYRAPQLATDVPARYCIGFGVA